MSWFYRGLAVWRAFDPAWRFALGAYLVARVALSVWALVIALVLPVVVENLDLFGAPTLAVFELASGERYAYSREVAGATLTFRAGDSGLVTDMQTGSVWSLREARAIAGKYTGQTFAESVYPVEDIFPYRGVAAEQNIWLSTWQRFDANWYLKIAQRGYVGDDGSMVYFPLYPFLIRLAGGSAFAAIVISNLALIGVLVFLYRLTVSLFDVAIAQRVVAYWLLFPTAFFLSAAYTESLFLLGALGALDCARRDKWMLATLFGVLAALTRLQGALLIVPLAWMAWRQVNSQKMQAKSRFAIRSFGLALIPLATFAFLVGTNLSLFNTYTDELHARFVLPWENFGAAIGLLAQGRASLSDLFNVIVTLGFGVLLIAVWRALPFEYTLFTGMMYLAPLFRMTTTQPLVSMDRYVLVLIPAFIILAGWGKNAWVNRCVVYLAFPLQLYLCAQFVLWGWVG